MESRYDFRTIEKKWRAEWEKNPINKEDAVKPKFYCLDMFPYPSGSGLHVGHWRGYVLSDVVSRYKVLQGYRYCIPWAGTLSVCPQKTSNQNEIHTPEFPQMRISKTQKDSCMKFLQSMTGIKK